MNPSSHPERHQRIDAIIAANPKPSQQLVALKKESTEVMMAIFDLLRCSLSENPELEKLLQAITAQHKISRDELLELFSYPNVQDMMIGIESAFVHSRASSVKKPILPALQKEILDVETRAFNAEVNR